VTDEVRDHPLRWRELVVLIAEDEVLIAMDLSQRVRDYGPIVLGPVATVREGLRLMKSKMPDAAILDVNLSDGEVTPLARELMAAGIPTVLCTANERYSVPNELMALANIGKPATDLRLEAAMRTLLNPV
jgi:two-component SAPR family response regulator